MERPWANSDRSESGPDFSAGVICPGTAKTLWAEMEGHNRLFGGGDIKPSTAKYTFHGILRSPSFGPVLSVHNNILQHQSMVERLFIGLFCIIAPFVPLSKVDSPLILAPGGKATGIDSGDDMAIICLPVIK